MKTFDSLGAQQDLKIILLEPETDCYGNCIFPGETILEMPNGDKIHPGDFRQYVEDMEEQELKEALWVEEVIVQ